MPQPTQAELVDVLREAVDAMDAFTDPEGNMPNETGEFQDLKAALAKCRELLGRYDGQPARST